MPAQLVQHGDNFDHSAWLAGECLIEHLVGRIQIGQTLNKITQHPANQVFRELLLRITPFVQFQVDLKTADETVLADTQVAGICHGFNFCCLVDQCAAVRNAQDTHRISNDQNEEKAGGGDTK